jgi:secondary thiamine-phosphate synthase enzyme
MVRQEILEWTTAGRGTYEITREVQLCTAAAGIVNGLCHLFAQHTSASLMLCENADPSVRRDLETFMAHLVTDGDRRFEHVEEGPDDMSAHVRSVLIKMELTLPVRQGCCALGTWQGIYLWEHRARPHRRRVVVTLIGDGETRDLRV